MSVAQFIREREEEDGCWGEDKCYAEHHKLTSLGVTASGELRSTHPPAVLRCWLEQEGTRGPDTGVSPVPPSISESKLNGSPLLGVEIGTPPATVSHDTDLGIANAGGTANVLGRGRFIGGGKSW